VAQDWSATRGVLSNEWDHDQQTKSDFWLLRNGVATHAGAAPRRGGRGAAWPHLAQRPLAGVRKLRDGTSVYVRPLDSVESRCRSRWVESEPRWRADGRELFYLSGDLSLMALEVDQRLSVPPEVGAAAVPGRAPSRRAA
jgi:hypothetical protein